MCKKALGLIIGVSLISGFIAVNNSFALEQEIPHLKDVRVKAGATFDSVTERYHYDYTVFHSTDSTGEIDSFYIDIVQPPNSKIYSPEGYIINGGIGLSGKKITNSFIHEAGDFHTILDTPLIPVGINIPFGWSGWIKPPGTAYWGGIEAKTFILPGISLNGFELISEGLPGVRSYQIQPVFNYEPEGEGEAGPEDLQRFDAIEKEITVTGKTVGPTAPPVPFVPVDFVTYIIDLKHQAQTLGWVGGPNFVLELDKKLDQIKTKLAGGEIEPAREELGAFIEKVEAHYKETKGHEMEKIHEGEKKGLENKKFITSEGYALMKFNAAYLRDQLGKPKEMADDKEQEKEHKK